MPKSINTNQRRQYISEQILEEHRDQVEFSEVLDKFGEVSEQTLHNDAKALARAGKRIAIESRAFVFDIASSDNLSVRRSRGHARKKAIGEAAARIAIMGELPAGLGVDNSLLVTKLRELKRKPHCLIALDAGSTTEHVARSLSSYRVPSPVLSSLRIITNSTSIARITQSQTPNRHGLIFMGGKLRADTESVCGILAERCLEAMQVEPDICIIGASGIGESYSFACNHEDEAEIKSRILDRSRIKCIVLDSSKVIKQYRSSAWPFASLHVSSIDLVVTDRPDREVTGSTKYKTVWNCFLSRAHESGVIVACVDVQRPGEQEKTFSSC